MKRKILVTVLIWVWEFGDDVFAQKENYVWYFGDSAGVDFNSGSPVALTNSAMYQWEGCSSISDANGNLLFYTDGVTVWDSTHTAMPGGSGLAGGYSSTQSALITAMPGNNQQYYIFTVPENFVMPYIFCYSIVDMTLNNGKGNVTILNNILQPYVTEKIAAVRHSNGTDIWVMVHGYGNDSLFAYLVTAGGVSSTPVASKIGPVIPTTAGVGYMKFSPDGSKIAFADDNPDYVDLFDFNSTTGVVTNEKYLDCPASGTYGLEFSASGHYLYCSLYTGTILQWDITSNSAAVINATLQQIGSFAFTSLGALQLGPDGKIYLTKNSAQYLGVINNPDSSGVLCNYVDNAVFLGGNICTWGLPNSVASYFLPTAINTTNPQQNQLTIFPNPATDKINISFPVSSSQHITTKIFSVTGEVVFEEENKTGSNYFSETINVKDFSNGIYFLSIRDGSKMFSEKVVIRK